MSLALNLPVSLLCGAGVLFAVVCGYKLLKASAAGQALPGGRLRAAATSAGAGGATVAVDAAGTAALVTTLLAAIAYTVQCLHGGAAPGTMPDPSAWVLWAAGGGQSAHVLAKIHRLYQKDP